MFVTTSSGPQWGQKTLCLVLLFGAPDTERPELHNNTGTASVVPLPGAVVSSFICMRVSFNSTLLHENSTPEDAANAPLGHYEQQPASPSTVRSRTHLDINPEAAASALMRIAE